MDLKRVFFNGYQRFRETVIDLELYFFDQVWNVLFFDEVIVGVFEPSDIAAPPVTQLPVFSMHLDWSSERLGNVSYHDRDSDLFTLHPFDHFRIQMFDLVIQWFLEIIVLDLHDGVWLLIWHFLNG